MGLELLEIEVMFFHILTDSFCEGERFFTGADVGEKKEELLASISAEKVFFADG